MDSKGYVAVFSRRLTQEHIRECVASWLERFEKVEQVAPGGDHGIYTVPISKPEDLMWDEQMQMRIVASGDFSWIYLSPKSQVIETSGLASDIPEQIALCLDVLLELPDVIEIVDEHNEKRLEELEKEGFFN